MSLSELLAAAGGSAGIAVLAAVALTPWLAVHAQDGLIGSGHGVPGPGDPPPDRRPARPHPR